MSSPANSSGLRSADAAVLAQPGRLLGIQAYGDGTNAATITIYDNASAASGTVIGQVLVDAGLVYESADIPEPGVVCNNGIYVDVTGTGANYIIYYTLS